VRPFPKPILSATASQRPENTPPECFCGDDGVISSVPTWTWAFDPRFIPPLNKKEPYGSFVLVEAAGIEPASENLLTQLSPGAEYLLYFPTAAPVLRLRRAVAF